MPRSVAEILAHANELAARFEDYEPDPADEKDVQARDYLRRVATSRVQLEKETVAAVRQARQSGLSWKTIGAYLGTSGEAARQRYGALAS